MLIPPAYAQTAGSAQSSMLGSVGFFAQMALLFALFYFLMLRPQQKRAKQARALIDAVKKGDTVTTGGGIVGKVTRVEAAHVEVEIAPNVKVRVVKATLVTVGQPAAPAND